MTSCLHGHPVSPGSEFCDTCGYDVRPACGQGHRSGAGAQFCETCGEPHPAPPGGAPPGGEPAAPVLDYTSGSFADFISADESGPGGDNAGASGADATGADGCGDDGPGGHGTAAQEASVAEEALPRSAAGNGSSGPGARPMEPARALGRAAEASETGGVTSTKPMHLHPHLIFPEPWRTGHADVLASLPPYTGDPASPPRARLRSRAVTARPPAARTGGGAAA